MKTEITLGAISFFIEEGHFQVTFTESRPVSLGQHGVDQFVLSRQPGPNHSNGVWHVLIKHGSISAARIAEAHRYCSERWGGDFEDYKNGWEPGVVRDGKWVPVSELKGS